MADRIALVDDDQNILTSVALALESEGFEVDSYSDSEAALAGITRRKVDLAVLDIKMRGWMVLSCYKNCVISRNCQ